MEGSGVGSGGCMCSAFLCAWRVSYVVGCSCYTEHGRHGLS